jgi:tetratricopeptide (TPR) repeat protein
MLEPYLKPVLSKHRGVALGVWGEAGVGKSYYITHLLKNLPCATLSVHSKVNLSTLVGQLPTPKKLPLWVSKTLEKTSQGESVENSNLISALGASLAALAPFVLHLEDIHEADPERLVFLTDLAQSIKKLKGVCLLVSSRQLPSEPFMAVKLESLTKEASDKLLEQELSATLPEESLQFIFSKAAGNPLFTLEYLRFLSRQGNLWNDGKSWYWRKPEQDRMPVVVEALLEQLIEQAKKIPLQAYVLEAKALLPLEASAELWQKAARVNANELKTTLQDLSRQGIFKSQQFAHPLFREVTLKTISLERKHHLSRRAVSALQDDPVQAVWFMDDAKLGRDEALDLLKRASEKVAKSNKILAGKLLAKAVGHATGEEKGKLALEVAQQFTDTDVTIAHHLANIAIQCPQTYQQATIILIELLAEQSRTDEAKQLLDKLELSEFDNIRQLIRIYGLAQDEHNVYELIQSCPEILNQADIFTITHFSRALVYRGLRSEAEQLLQKRLSSKDLTSTNRARLLQLQAILVGSYGNSSEMERLLAEALLLIKDSEENRLKETLIFNRAAALADIDRYEESKQCLKDAMNISLKLGDIKSYMATQSFFAKQLHLEGHYEQAEQFFLESMNFLKLGEVSPSLKYSSSFLSELYTDWQPLHGNTLAFKYASEALSYATQLNQNIGKADAITSLALAELTLGHFDKALQFAREATSIYTTFQAEAKYQSLCVEARALKALGDDAALDVLKYANAQTCQFGSKYQANCIGLELDQFYNDFESARTRMQWFEERGLMNGVNIARRYFPELATSDSSPIVLTTEEPPRLEVLGVMQLRQGDQLEPIKGSKRQDFLALLLEAKLSGHAERGRLELLDLLYPDQDELKASSNLRALVNSLRELMGASAIVTTASGYALGNVPSDAEQFLKTGETSLWRGVYLQGLGIEGQETVSESLYLTLFERAKGLLETDPKEVARVGKMLLEVDSYNRDYLRLCLQALRASSNHKSLTRLYHESAERFTEVGEQLPESWQKFLG